MVLRRLPDWEQRLADEIRASLALRFRWHDNDCCAFAARCVVAVTGQDLFATFRGAYRSRRSAEKVLGAHGGVARICDALLGDRRPALQSRRGEIVLVTGNFGEAIAVCNGEKALAPGPCGLTEIAQTKWLACWPIG